ncbi:MAG: GDP-mannose 4,6-dehydratase [Candidatus Wallbacteria bacterium]
MKIAVITGITGQDGPYLAKLLLEKDYKVIGLTRSYNTANLKGLEYLDIKNDVEICECDLTDIPGIMTLFEKYRPDEIYNLAAQSSVGLSFNQPIVTVRFNTISVLNMLECIKMINPKIKFYQASSSEMFGRVSQLPITEDYYFYPQSPYAISKASAHWIAVNYRDSYGLFTTCGILFNHESFLRSDNFFVKKVIRTAIAISKGIASELRVGNIDIKRDFGYAPKYVEAMWLMMQQEKPDNFIVCSGKSVSLREIIHYVFEKMNISADKLIIDQSLYRPADIDDTYGDNSKARNILNWDYNMNFFEVLDILIDEELRNYK